MPLWAQRLVMELDDADRRATAVAGTLTPAQLNWKPAPDVWSVGQCLEHLSISNEVYVPAIAAALSGRARSPVEEITPGWFGRWFVRNFMEPTPQMKRFRAPRKVTPAGSTVDPEILARFVRSNALVRDVIDRANDQDVNRIRFRNPFIPVIYFTVGTGLVITTTHERRHLLQAERIRQRADFPGA